MGRPRENIKMNIYNFEKLISDKVLRADPKTRCWIAETAAAVPGELMLFRGECSLNSDCLNPIHKVEFQESRPLPSPEEILKAAVFQFGEEDQCWIPHRKQVYINGVQKTTRHAVIEHVRGCRLPPYVRYKAAATCETPECVNPDHLNRQMAAADHAAAAVQPSSARKMRRKY